MISAPEANAVFTDEETRRIEAAKTRLANLEMEIVIASKNLSAIQSETLKATEEKKYQEQLLAALTDDVARTREEVNGLTTRADLARESLTVFQKERESLKEKADILSKEISERVDLLTQNEASFSEKLKEVTDRATKNEADRKEIEAVHEALTAALKTIPWSYNKESAG